MGSVGYIVLMIEEIYTNYYLKGIIGDVDISDITILVIFIPVCYFGYKLLIYIYDKYL